MRICIAGPSFGYGGANIIAATVGKELAKKNEVYYYSYKYDDNYSDLPDNNLFFCSKKEKKIFSKFGKGIEMLIKKEFTPSKYKKNEIKELYRIIDEQKIDLIILNSFIAVTIFAKELKKNYPKIPIIAWMHESVEHSFGSLAKNYLTAYTDSLKTVDQIVCLTKKDLLVFKKYNENSTVIYNPIQFISIKKSKLTTPVISFTTRLDINIKGLDYLMQVAKELPKDWVIRVAANGSENQIAEFKKLISDEDVKDKIIYVGPLKGEQLINHYLESSIFISTSRVESFQLVLIEAMECGLPIISFAHSGALEVLKNGEFGILVKNFNVQEMSTQIRKLIDNKKEMINLQMKSIMRSKDFNLTKIISEWNLLLEKWV